MLAPAGVTAGTASATVTGESTGVDVVPAVMSEFKLAMILTVTGTVEKLGGTFLSIVATAAVAGTPGSTAGLPATKAPGTESCTVKGPVPGVLLYGAGILAVT